MLYPGNGKALFLQLKDLIMEKINSGEYSEGDKIPSERDLAETYHISRLTVRQALTEMVQEGRLNKKHGKGYFVAEMQIENRLDIMQGFVEELIAKNMKFKVQLTEKRFVLPEEKIVEALRLENDRHALMIVRNISVDDKPLSIDYTYVPMNIAHLIEPLDMNQVVLYEFLDNNGYKLVGADQTISAGVLTPAEAKQLNKPVGFPVLIIDRAAFIQGHLPIVFSHTLYLSDRYHYTLTLARK